VLQQSEGSSNLQPNLFRDVSKREDWDSGDIQHAEVTMTNSMRQLRFAASGISSKLAFSGMSKLSLRVGQRSFWAECWAIHPQSSQRLLWDVLSVVFILHGLVMLPLSAFDLPTTSTDRASEYIIASFWTCDMMMSFRSGFFSGIKLTMDPYLIAVNYIKNWFLPDVCIVSAEWVAQILFGNSPSSARLIRVPKIVRFLRGLRGLKLIQTFSKLEAIVTSSWFVLCFSLLKMGSLLSLGVHFMTCGWYAVGSQADGWVTKSRLGLNDGDGFGSTDG